MARHDAAGVAVPLPVDDVEQQLAVGGHVLAGEVELRAPPPGHEGDVDPHWGAGARLRSGHDVSRRQGRGSREPRSEPHAGTEDRHGRRGRHGGEPAAPGAPSTGDPGEQRRDALVLVAARRRGREPCVRRQVWAADGTGEVEQARQTGELTQLGLAVRARAQVLGEGAVVGVRQAAEEIGAEEHVQLVGSAGHLVTPISSRMTRRLRTA